MAKIDGPSCSDACPCIAYQRSSEAVHYDGAPIKRLGLINPPVHPALRHLHESGWTDEEVECQPNRNLQTTALF